jgi:hypothetical protein
LFLFFVCVAGRTGRAGKTGEAFSLIVSEAPKLMRDLRDILVRANQPIPPELGMISGGGGGGRGGRGRYGGGGRGGYGHRDAYPPRDMMGPGGPYPPRDMGGYPPRDAHPPREELKRERSPYRPDDRLDRDDAHRGPRAEPR